MGKDPKIGRAIVGNRLKILDKKEILPQVIEALDLESILEREVN